jgi:nitrogen regulatory protein PII
MTVVAQQLVIDRLTTHVFDSKFKAEIMRIVKFIQNGEGSDGKVFVGKMTQTDTYRKQSLLGSHPEIAKAMGYVSN